MCGAKYKRARDWKNPSEKIEKNTFDKIKKSSEKMKKVQKKILERRKKKKWRDR